MCFRLWLMKSDNVGTDKRKKLSKKKGNLRDL